MIPATSIASSLDQLRRPRACAVPRSSTRFMYGSRRPLRADPPYEHSGCVGSIIGDFIRNSCSDSSLYHSERVSMVNWKLGVIEDAIKINL